MGGIGKTALALKAAAALAPQYHDGQIYLDLLGVTTPLTPEQAMAHVICSFRPQERVPESRAAMEALYREVLFGKHVLLVMDNAAGREQVEPLLPPAGSAFLVTSRFRFSLAGWRSRDLDELPAEEAEALLMRICPRIGDAAQALARLCGGLPLALTLAGSALFNRPDLDPAAYAAQLAQGRIHLEPVDASLDLSCKLLPEPVQALFLRLAVFPGTFDAAAAGAVWELDTIKRDAALGTLLTSSLLEWEEQPRRYRLHDLARIFAGRRLPSVQEAAARMRHAVHFLAELYRANELFLAGGQGVGDGLALFDTEWGNIRAGQRWAAEQPLADTVAARLCSDYGLTGIHCLGLRFHPSEQIRWREAALRAAQHLGDRRAEAGHLGSLGLSYRHLGHTRRALALQEERLQIARSLLDRRDEGFTWGVMGKLYTDLGDPRQAITCHLQRLAIARELNDPRSEGHALGNLATAYRYVGDLEQAIAGHAQQRAILEPLGDRRGVRQAVLALGRDYTVLGQPEQAIPLIEEGLAIARKMGDARGEGLALGGLSAAYIELGNAQRGIELSEQFLAMVRQQGDRRLEGYALGNLGLAYAALGEPPRAIDYQERHLTLAHDIGDRWGEALASWRLGHVLAVQGNLSRAIELMQRWVDLQWEVDHPHAAKNEAQVAALRQQLAP